MNYHQQHPEQKDVETTIAALRRELEARDESIFDLEATLITVEAEKQYTIENTQREAAQRVRQLQEELRRTQHEANLARRARNNNNTSTTASTTTAANHSRRTMLSPPPTATVTPRVAAATAAPPMMPAGAVKQRSSAERLLDHLRHYERWNDRVSFSLGQQLQTCTTEVHVLWIVLTEQSSKTSERASHYERLALVLEHSPTACSFLVHGVQSPGKRPELPIDLLHPLWEPVDDDASAPSLPTILQQQHITTWFESTYHFAMKDDASAIEALRVLEILVRENRTHSFTLPEPFLDETLWTAWIGSLQASLVETISTTSRRLLKYPVEPLDRPRRSAAWLHQVSRLLRHSLWRRHDEDQHHRRWLTTGRLATVLATLLDWLERSNLPMTDEQPQQLSADEVLRWLQAMASNEYDWLLRMQLVTDRSTTDHWHRAPTAVTVVLRFVSQPHPAAVDAAVVVDFFHGVLLGIQHNRRLQQQATTSSKRQQPCLSFWDVLHPHVDAFTSHILEPLRTDPRVSADIQAKLQLQLEELEEDRAERFGDTSAVVDS